MCSHSPPTQYVRTGSPSPTIFADEVFAFFDFHNDGRWELSVMGIKGGNPLSIAIMYKDYTVDGSRYTMTITDVGVLEITPEDINTAVPL